MDDDVRPMRVEFEDDEIDGEIVTTVRFVLNESHGGAGSMQTWEADEAAVMLEWDDAPHPDAGFDEPTCVHLMGMDALIAAYEAHRARDVRHRG